MRSSNDVTLAVIDALDACGVPYMLVGSYSSNMYGINRSTMDADFVIQLGSCSILDVARRLPPTVRVDPQLGFETVTMTRKYDATVEGSDFRVEFFLLSDEPYHQERFRRRVSHHILGRTIWFPTPEDVIVTKLRWARSKDIDDARDVIAVQGAQNVPLDWDYIHAWCDRHGTRALLDEIRRSIPPI